MEARNRQKTLRLPFSIGVIGVNEKLCKSLKLFALFLLIYICFFLFRTYLYMPFFKNYKTKHFFLYCDRRERRGEQDTHGIKKEEVCILFKYINCWKTNPKYWWKWIKYLNLPIKDLKSSIKWKIEKHLYYHLFNNPIKKFLCTHHLQCQFIIYSKIK